MRLLFPGQIVTKSFAIRNIQALTSYTWSTVYIIKKITSYISECLCAS